MRGRATAAVGALLAGMLLLAGSAAMNGASAQAKQTDAHWQPWLGCWEPAGAINGLERMPSSDHMLCVLPVEGSSAVELATVDSGRVLVRERVEANGERMTADQGGCKGWKSASWSPSGEQLYLKSDLDCGGGLHRASTGIFAMAPGGTWLDVQGISAKNGGGVRVIRYRSTPAPDLLRDELARVTADRELALSTARTAASGDVSIDEIVSASHAVDPSVVEAWLIERRQKFDVDSKKLVELADAGVPSRVIDAMVALSYPKVFAIAGSSDVGMRSGEVALQSGEQSGRTIPLTMYPSPYGYNSFGYGFGFSPYDYYYSPYGYSPYGFGFGYGYGWYPGSGPVVIIRNPGNDAASAEHGKVVNGRGYVRGKRSTDNGSASDRGSMPRRSRGDWPSASGSSSSGSSTASPSSSGQSTGRTAKPRKP
jgi:hypothetical protein